MVSYSNMSDGNQNRFTAIPEPTELDTIAFETHISQDFYHESQPL